ncbi:unannotated protein [freshwater metagenome]|uniref:Unannotated protein n=1 Tax=freshwater metagenome TaxID=449393 RepID=A0A6J6R095_9ZZZZ
MPGGRTVNINRRVDPTLCCSTIESKFHISGPLELLEDDLVHFGIGVDESSCQNRQRATLFNIPGCSKEALGWVQGTSVEATTHDAATIGSSQVVGAG